MAIGMSDSLKRLGGERMDDLFARVKDVALLPDVIGRYGVKLRQQGKNRLVGLCPFHREKSGSFTVYADSNRFHCFGCAVSGSAIDFISRMNGTTPLESAKYLASMYHIPTEHEPSPDEAKKWKDEKLKRERERKIKQSLRNWEIYAHDVLASCYRHMTHDLEDYSPDSGDVFKDSLYEMAAHWHERIEYMLDCLDYSSDGQKLELYKKYHERVDALYGKYLRQRNAHTAET